MILRFFKLKNKAKTDLEKAKLSQTEVLRLFQLFFEKNNQKAPKQDLVRILHDCLKVSKEFFDCQKYCSLKCSYNYKDCPQKHVHKNLIKKFDDKICEFEHGWNDQITNDFVGFLESFISEYIAEAEAS